MSGRTHFGFPASAALVAALVGMACVACASTGSSSSQGDEPPGAGSGTSGVTAAENGSAVAATLGELIDSGPAYTPFDVGPVLRPGAWLPDLLAENLVPVLESRGLPANTRALVWGLIAEDGTVASAVLQTTSGSEDFDAAAITLADSLRYTPARLDETVVPVWILINVSMLLR